ncbi:MAG TPA: rhomboid family intramembrane serine protease [Solirubrobacteraceae bacterium]|nr:rhomboid family intramembrane serine protease [Solirubrobacteraceae bacterium]
MFPLKDNIPLSRFPLVTIALVAINVVAYSLSVRHGGSFFGGPADATLTRHGAVPFELTHAGSRCLLSPLAEPGHPVRNVVGCLPQHQLSALKLPVHEPATWQTVFSSLVLHGSFVSLLADVLALAIFGPNVEDACGRLRFLCFYALGALLAVALQVLLAPNSPFPAFGACGAVAAVLGAYVLLYPRARVIALAPVPFVATILALPGALLIAVWLLAQLWFELVGLAGTGHGWFGLLAPAYQPVHGSWLTGFLAVLGAAVAGAVVIGPFASADRRAAKAHRTPHQPVY